MSHKSKITISKKIFNTQKSKNYKTIDKNINDITKLIFKRSLLDAKIKYISKKKLKKK